MSRIRRAVEPYLPPIAALGAIALIVELVSLRVLTRTAIHIPGLERFAIGYRVVSGVGRLAFSVGIVLVVALMVVMAIAGALSGRLWFASVLSVVLSLFAFAAMGIVPELVIDAVTVLAVVSVPFALFDLGSRPWSWSWLSPILFIVAFAVAGLPTIVSKAAPELVVPVAGMWEASEALAVIAGIALLARVTVPLLRKSVLVASIAGTLAFASLVAQPAATKTLMLWNLGLAGYFHPIVYAAAVGCVVYAVHRAWMMGDRSVAIGIAFVVAGGVGLHSTIQSAAFLMGVVILLEPLVVSPSLSGDGSDREEPAWMSR